MGSDDNASRLHAVIEGHVQGVNFRYFVIQKAISLGITGWVRNRYDGSVEVIAEGQRSKLDRLLVALRQGPPSATVTAVQQDWQASTGEYSDFNVLPTK